MNRASLLVAALAVRLAPAVSSELLALLALTDKLLHTTLCMVLDLHIRSTCCARVRDI
eukprot:SAG11_NODE_2754_length_3007_cov_10.651307_3_plen_58_part_00